MDFLLVRMVKGPIEFPLTIRYLVGYAYKALRVTDYISISVFILHKIVALSHTLHLLLTRCSYASWDTVEELIALA